MVNTVITINRQDTYTRTINLIDSSGNPIDATGWIIYFTVRTTASVTSIIDDTNALITKTIAGDVSGVQTLTLTSTQTDVDPGTYKYDIQIKKTDDTISSSTAAAFIINGDISRSTA